MSSGYALPVAAWLTRDTGERFVRLPDGREMSLDEWRKARVTPEEFARLASIRQRRRTSAWDPIARAPEDPDDL